jgi:hypothetical protein
LEQNSKTIAKAKSLKAELYSNHRKADAVEDTSTRNHERYFQKSDKDIADGTVSNTTKSYSNRKDAESSTYEPLFGTKHYDTSDTATTYSLDSSTNNSNTEYLRAFAEQLAKDLKVSSISTKLSDVPPSYISEALRIFTWKLHEESTDRFQWGVSVVLNQNRRYVVP